MFIIPVFQCLDWQVLATCAYCITSPTPTSFSPAFALELWITVLVRGGRRMGSVCAQGFPKGNTEAPSLCCISQNTECCTSEHDMGSRASLCEWKLLGMPSCWAMPSLWWEESLRYIPALLEVMCDWEVSELLLAENCHGRLEGRAWNCKREGFRDLSLPHPGLGPWGGRELGVANKEF